MVLERSSPFLLYRESDSVVRALRDYLTNEIGEILIDDEATYKDAYEHVEQTMPHNLKKLKHYVDPVPLFTRFQIESQIESAFAHDVTLPAGGSIVIDHTEALVSIDINSARATKGGDIEATAFNTNLEAADEIARQLRIRDLGGLIVIDFIDMGPQKHQREVENRLRDAVRQDRARVQIGKISRFGLMEMSRQRLRPSIGEASNKTCPRCTGFGTIRGTESLALAILRIIGEEARKERTSKVIAQLPVEVATYLLNEKRDWVQNLEDRNETQVVLVANPHLETPHYDVRRVRDDQTELPENSGASFALAQGPVEPESPQAILERKGAETAAVGTLKPSTPAPKRKAPVKEGSGLWATILGWFGVGDDQKKTKKKPQQRNRNNKKGRGRRSQQQSRGRNDNRRNTKTGEKRTGQQKKKKATRKPQNKKQTQGNQKAKDDNQQHSDEAKTEQKKTRSRRSRGGRRRRRTSEDGEQGNENQKTQTESVKAEAAKNEPAKNEPPKTETSPVERKPRPPRKPKSDGPPKARTDAERESSNSKLDDTASHRAPKTNGRSKPESKSDDASVPSAAARPAPKPAAEKPAPKPTAEKPVPASAADKPAPKPAVESPAPKPVAAKPAAKPAPEPAKETKPGARLLPWDAD